MNVDDVGEWGIKAPPRAVMAGRDDNVAVLLSDVQAGQTVMLSGGRQTTATEDMPSGHKMAVCALKPGQAIINFGQIIGIARRIIQPGERIHYHNINLSKNF